MKNERPIILCDVDDTIADLVPVWLSVYNCDWNDHLEKEDILSWDIGNYTKIKDAFYDYLHDENLDLYYAIEPISGSKEGVETLRKLGFRVVFVTAYDYFSRKFAWLKTHGFLDEDRNYVVAKDKTLIRGDYMIDDSFDNVESFQGCQILFDAPWNKKFYHPNRAHDWEEALAMVESTLYRKIEK